MASERSRRRGMLAIGLMLAPLAANSLRSANRFSK
jgi:hypothetical protein